MAVTNGYTTVSGLRAHFADTASSLPEELLERAINAASRSVDAYCGRRFWCDAEPQVRTYRIEDPFEVDVDDIATTDGMVVATDNDGDGTAEAVWSATDFALGPENADGSGGAYAWWRLVAVAGRRFPVELQPSALDTRGPARGRGRARRLQVTARFGWSQVPPEVEQATILKAAQLARRKDAPFGVAGFGDFGVVRLGRFDPDVVGLLAPFVRLGVEAV